MEEKRGSQHNDVLRGEGGNDRLVGASGDDKLDGGIGEDLLVGGNGNDVLLGRAGADVALGSAGNDTLVGGAGDDILSGGSGRDTLRGGSGFDLLSGGAGADRLFGGAGNDMLSYEDSTAGVRIDLGKNTASGGDAQGDVISGFEGVTGGSRKDVLIGSNVVIKERDGRLALISSGENRLVGGAGNDRLYGLGGNDELEGGLGADRLDGGDGDDVLRGGGGNDMLQGGLGKDVLLGGTGNDMASFADLAPSADGMGIVADLKRQTVGGVAEGDRFNSIEGVIGTAGQDALLGDKGLNRLDGNAGDDVLDGRGGNDKLYGGDGNDVILDLKGDNDLIGGEGNDRLIAGRGRDILDGENGNDLLSSGAGDDLMKGGRGRDTLVGGAGADLLYGQNGRNRLEGGAGNDRLVVTRGDTAIGGAGVDTAVIDGRGGQFEVQMLANGRVRLIDKVRGRNGTLEFANVERFQFRDGMYRVKGDALVRIGDVAPENRSAWNVPAEVSSSLNDAVRSVERTLNRFIGVQANKTDTADNATEGASAMPKVAPSPTPETTVSFANQPVGAGVNVNLAAGTAVVTNGASIGQPVPLSADIVAVNGTQAADVITGNAGANVLRGLAGRDTLNGGAGNDRLVGGAGADTLRGGTGDDRIIGGVGRDTLVLQGRAERYTVRQAGDRFRIIDNRTGSVDVTQGVEFVRFGNGTGDAMRLAELARKT